jgi:uncharacterized protein YndB with AHSA1/START domain
VSGCAAPSDGYGQAMAYTSRTLAASRSAVWDVLIDPHTYPDWLIGAASIRSVDDTWPSVGSRFRHRVGIGWLSIPDHSEVLDIDPGRMLRLMVEARPLIAGVVTFELVSDATGTVVAVEEEPLLRIIGNIVRPVMDPTIHLRNHRSLRRLDRIVQERVAATGGAGAASVPR